MPFALDDLGLSSSDLLFSIASGQTTFTEKRRTFPLTLLVWQPIQRAHENQPTS